MADGLVHCVEKGGWYPTVMNWITMTRKSGEHLRATYGNTGQLFRTYKDSSAVLYRDLHHWKSNQWPQNADPKFYHWAVSSLRTQVMPNQVVMVIAWPINLNVLQVTSVLAGFSVLTNPIHNIIPLLKENVHLYPCLWGQNDYADAYFQSPGKMWLWKWLCTQWRVQM